MRGRLPTALAQRVQGLRRSRRPLSRRARLSRELHRVRYDAADSPQGVVKVGGLPPKRDRQRAVMAIVNVELDVRRFCRLPRNGPQKHRALTRIAVIARDDSPPKSLAALVRRHGPELTFAVARTRRPMCVGSTPYAGASAPRAARQPGPRHRRRRFTGRARGCGRGRAGHQCSGTPCARTRLGP